MSFLDSLMAGLALVGNVEAFLALGIGVAIGVVGGAIPGMSATMAVAPACASGGVAGMAERRAGWRGWRSRLCTAEQA